MRYLLIFLLALPQVAQHKATAPSKSDQVPHVSVGRYCGGDLTTIPETFFQKLRRIAGYDSSAKAIAHVTFNMPCVSTNSGAIGKHPAWMWVLNISDINAPDDSGAVKTLNESARGMDIEGYVGHVIDWRVSVR